VDCAERTVSRTVAVQEYNQAMTDRLPETLLDGWLRLADAIEANGTTAPLDLESLVQQAHEAARGLRSLVAAVRGDGSGPPLETEDEVWMPDGMGGGTRVKVKPEKS
jgi:hypothetical protein